MTKSPGTAKRLPWEKPQFSLIKLGDAQTKDNSGGFDGGKGSTDKS